MTLDVSLQTLLTHHITKMSLPRNYALDLDLLSAGGL